MNAKLDAKVVGKIAGLFHEMMKMFGRASDGGMLRLIAEFDLSLPQLISLDMMSLSPQTISSLSAELRLTPGAVSRLVDQLVHKKLVSREEDIGDRRQKSLNLTAAGRRVVNQLERARTGNFTKVVSEFDRALAEDFKAVLERIVAMLRSHTHARHAGGSPERPRTGKAPGERDN